MSEETDSLDDQGADEEAAAAMKETAPATASKRKSQKEVEAEMEEMRQKQMWVNFKWLLDRIDGVHHQLCPKHMGTWQERAIQAETAAFKIVEAVKPFIHFVNQWERKPLRSGDEFYGIHNGTEFGATLRISDLQRLRDLFKGLVVPPSTDRRDNLVNEINSLKKLLSGIPDDPWAKPMLEEKLGELEAELVIINKLLA